MIPPHLQSQIAQQIEETRTQSMLAQIFSLINSNHETAAQEREDDKLSKARYWWQEKESK